MLKLLSEVVTEQPETIGLLPNYSIMRGLG
jgi:hypothetical protein